MMNRRHRGSIIAPVYFDSRFIANTSTKTASLASTFTPPADTLILVIAYWHGQDPSTTTGISDTIGGLTWTELTSGWHKNVPQNFRYAKSSVFWAVTGSSPPNGNITITEGVAGFGLGFHVLWFPNADIASPIGNVGYAHLDGSFGGSVSLANSVTSSGAKFVLSCLVSPMEGGSLPLPSVADDSASFTSLLAHNESSSGVGVLNYAAYSKNGVDSDTWNITGTNNYQFWWDDAFLIEINE